jgi:hypothetical protein
MRLDHADLRIPAKVAGIESEQVGGAVSQHNRHQPRIMDIDAQDAVRTDQAAPFAIDAGGIWQHRKMFSISTNSA